MDLEGIMQSEISQTEKDKYHMISLVCRILINKVKTNINTENRVVWLPERKELGEGQNE